MGLGQASVPIGRPRGVARASAQAFAFEIVIGLDHFAQLILRAARAIIGVGMVPFHQGLETRLDLLTARRLVEIESLQTAALHVAESASRPALVVAAGPIRAVKKIEGVVGVEAPSKAAGPFRPKP